MGRDPDHELTVESKLASRNHAEIEYTNGKFVLSDHSTNGTFILTGEGETIHLHRETFLLQGNGQISLGQDFSDNPTSLHHQDTERNSSQRHRRDHFPFFIPPISADTTDWLTS